MKSPFRHIILVSAFLFASFLACSQENKLSTYDSLGTMPPFKYYFPNGSAFAADNMSKKHSTVMIYFKDDCPYCNKQAKIIEDNIKDFDAIDFVFISRDDTATINIFARNHKLQNNAQVSFLQDKDKMYYSFCTAQYTPSIHIYNKKKELLYYTQGIMKKEEILKFVQ